MAAGGRVAAPTNHDVVEVLVASLPPFGSGTGSACVWACDEPESTLDRVRQHQARARSTIHFRRVGTGNDWRDLVKQTGKKAHGVTSA